MLIKNTRPNEAILVSSAFLVYVAKRLFDESKHLNSWIQHGQQNGISRDQMLEGLADYTYLLHTVFPIIGGAILLLAAWLLFHLVVAPNIRLVQRNTNSLLLAGGLSVLLIFASLFLFHYLRIYIRYSRPFYDNIYDNVIEVKTYSLCRKKTVLGDAIGIGFLFVFFELTSSVFRYLYRQILKEKESFATVVAYFLPFLPAGFLFFLALNTNLPTPLWSGDTAWVLSQAGYIVMIWALHAYMAHYLFPYFKEKKKLFVLHLLIFVAIWLLGNGLIYAARSNFNPHYTWPLYRHPLFKGLMLTLSAAIGLAIFRRTFFKEQIILQQQVAGTSAELSQLRSQINPHFLFNALNSLYAAAMKETAAQTADGIQRLGDIMRFMLQENNQERISVEKEIEYLHNYIHLQRIRIDETQGIDIKVVLNQPDSEVYIAPMILIPFVENAFKHGISHRYPSWIFITLSFDATNLYFRVQNSRHIRQERDPEEYQSGIGLENVQKRLNLLYPGRHTLQIQESDQDYIASLTLSLW